MNGLTGNLIGRGVQGAVYDANPIYGEYLASSTPGPFVVKVIDYEAQGGILYNNNVHDDIIHKLTVYETIHNHKPSHVLPCLHWTVYFNERFNLDSSVNSIKQVRTIPVRKLSMAFPKLEGVLWDETIAMSPLNRKDVCLQLIGVLRSLHAIEITHDDLHLKNIMYTKNARGYYVIWVIDMDYANYSGSIDRDYRYLVNNITLILYGEFFRSCERIKYKPDLYNCLRVIKDRSNGTVMRVNAFNQLNRILSTTVFSEEELFWGDKSQIIGSI
jgi:serine/threonine protein kinase